MCAILKIPIELLGSYKRDPDNFICDMANYPREPIVRYFKNPNALYAAVQRSRINRFDFKTHELHPALIAKSSKIRYMHFDLSLGGDLCAFAMSHASHFVDQEEITEQGISVTSKLPFHFIDVLGVILNPKGDQVWLPLVTKIIRDLSEKRGYNIGLITFDRFQSAYIMQTLRDYGFISASLSIDRTANFPLLDNDRRNPDGYRKETTEGKYTSAMASLRDSVNHRRISIPHHPSVDGKASESEFEIEAKGAHEDITKKKVTHTSESNLDLLQAVAGAVFNVENNERYDTTKTQLNNEELHDPFYKSLIESRQPSRIEGEGSGFLGESIGGRDGGYLG